jgi:hypothetical protein
MGLTQDEKDFVGWYKSLDTVERLAVNCWLERGDDRLIIQLRPHRTRLQQWSYLRAPHGQCLRRRYH